MIPMNILPKTLFCAYTYNLHSAKKWKEKVSILISVTAWTAVRQADSSARGFSPARSIKRRLGMEKTVWRPSGQGSSKRRARPETEQFFPQRGKNCMFSNPWPEFASGWLPAQLAWLYMHHGFSDAWQAKGDQNEKNVQTISFWEDLTHRCCFFPADIWFLRMRESRQGTKNSHRAPCSQKDPQRTDRARGYEDRQLLLAQPAG